MSKAAGWDYCVDAAGRNLVLPRSVLVSTSSYPLLHIFPVAYPYRFPAIPTGQDPSGGSYNAGGAKCPPGLCFLTGGIICSGETSQRETALARGWDSAVSV